MCGIGPAPIPLGCYWNSWPLLRAATKGYGAVLVQLLDKVPRNIRKGLIDSKDIDNGQTSLSWAAKNGHNRVVELLLKTGMVDLDSMTENGQTPLAGS